MPQRLPATIGRYRIIRLLGEGGMGSVYEAEQDQPRRRVALKMIRSGWVSSELIRRFELELHTLGRLHHPCIAQIYDAGSIETPYGPQPFFAMELVDGKPLLEYANKKSLALRERLALMVRICEAVEHAHQRGVIHRDLKPGNILVEDSGQPKILDFGLARVTDSDVQVTRQTDLGQILGTLPYMSPEQVQADPSVLDTRSDVYALGVILYELLAGKLPYQLSRSLPEAVQTIQQIDPAPLSTVNRTFRGDVETIVGKALEKDKERRYGSAAGLAADIGRYLEDRPITAKPASASYQLKKFARRNKVLVAGVAAVFMVLIAGLAISSYEAFRARRAERRAQSEAATSKAVVDFLQNDMLSQAGSTAQASAGLRPDPDIKVRTALDRAAQHIEGKFKDQPEVEASIRSTIGQAYMDMGVYPQAQTQFERALDLDRRVLSDKDPKTLTIMSNLGRLESLQAKNAQAAALLSQAFETQRRVLGPEHPDTLYTANWLANDYQNEARYAEAEALHSQVLEIRRRLLGPEHSDTLNVMNNLGLDYMWEAKYPQAEAILGQALEIRRRVSGPDHPDTLKPMINLSSVYYHEEKYAQAEPLTSQALEIQRRVLGPEHPVTVATMQGLANIYGSEGKSAKALTLQKEALEILQRVLGPEHPDTLRTMSALAGEYGRGGDDAKAEQLLSQTFEIQRRVLAPDHPDTLITEINLGIAKSRLGNYAGADQLFNQWFEAARRGPGAENPRTLNMISMFASIFRTGGRYALAEKYAAQLLTGRRRALGDQSPDTMAAAADLVLIYVSENKFAGAEPLAREVVQTSSKIQPDDWQRFRAVSLLGASLAGQKKYAEAKPLLEEGYQGMLNRKRSIADGDLYNLDLAHNWLVRSDKDSGKSTKAGR